MMGLDDGDAAAIERAGIGLAVLFAGAAAVALVGWLLAGCTQPPRPETALEASVYAAELEACAVQASTCPGYVACRSRVAAAHGRTYAGRCVP
jgi:hypothetical protein